MQCAGTSGELYDVHKDKEVCKLLPLKLAGYQQESFAQEEDFPPLTVVSILSQWKDLFESTGFDFGQGPARTHTSFIAIIVNDDCSPE